MLALFGKTNQPQLCTEGVDAASAVKGDIAQRVLKGQGFAGDDNRLFQTAVLAVVDLNGRRACACGAKTGGARDEDGIAMHGHPFGEAGVCGDGRKGGD